eukprot:scaffold536_cov142-Chaetoceros_neogracile.AAC.3
MADKLMYRGWEWSDSATKIAGNLESIPLAFALNYLGLCLWILDTMRTYCMDFLSIRINSGWSGTGMNGELVMMGVMLV